MVFKIAPAEAWQEASATGKLAPSLDDVRDGYIHLSTRAQLAGTLRKHFNGQTDLVLLAVDAEQLGPALRWESSRGGQLFPHLYGELEQRAVLQVWALAWRDGQHQIPELA